MTRLIAQLREFLAALEPRTSRPERTNEDQIAHESAALKKQALEQIADIA